MTKSSLAHRAYDLVYTPAAFKRRDERPDADFYQSARMVNHLDDRARLTIERIVGTLITEDEPAILDLMASWDSHLPPGLTPARVVGLGLNQVELQANGQLDERCLHDLNATPDLPFEDSEFDVVLCTVSVDYMTRPFDVFREVGRVLRPGGLFLVTFSDRMFPDKAVQVWRESGEAERIMLVEDFFADCGRFERPETFLQKGLPRPADDKYADTGRPSDPVCAVWAQRRGGPGVRRPRPEPAPPPNPDATWTPPHGDAAQREHVRATGCCPRCNAPLQKWEVPNTPFTEWDTEFLYLCFNDACPYVLGGWSEMSRQGNRSTSYRLAWHPEARSLYPIPVPSLKALRESIVPGEILGGEDTTT